MQSMIRERRYEPQLVLRGIYDHRGIALSWDWRWEGVDVWSLGTELSLTLARAKAEEALKAHLAAEKRERVVA